MTDSPVEINNNPPSRLMRRTVGGILWLLVFTALAVMWATNPQGAGKPNQENDAAKVLAVEQAVSDVEMVSTKVPDFSLTERSGQPITQEDLLGKPWVVNFIFTSCVASCPKNMAAMRDLAEKSSELGVQFVTVTVDPERDTPEKLANYAEIFVIDPEKWYFLTGEKEKIHRLILDGFALAVQEKFGDDRMVGYEFAHSDRVSHVDAEGTIVGQYLATDPTDMALLHRVLSGERETPENHRFLVPKQTDDFQSAEELADITTTEEEVEVVDTEAAAPDWLLQLPAVNAFLNGLATILLIVGFVLIKQKRITAHKTAMLSAFGVSVVFLACYLTYHFGLQYYTGETSKKFPDVGFARQVYLSILISHIILAVSVPFLACITIYRGLKNQIAQHRTMARITFPIWLYVSVTGVIIYFMLYHWAAA